MLLKGNLAYIQDSRLTLTTASFPAQTVKIPIPRVAPYALEWLLIFVSWTQNAAVTSGIVGNGFMNFLKRIVVGNVPNEKGKPSNQIDLSGAALLKYIANEGLNLDSCTLAALGANNIPNMRAAALHRICYAIPMAPPNFTDQLRPRCYLPLHTFNQDPILQMDFSAASEMSGDSDPVTAAAVEVAMVRREMPDAVIAKINASGGFMSWDLLESVTTLAAGLTNTAQKILVPTPGSYSGLLMSTLKGGATLVPGDNSGTVTVGSETEWQLRGAGKDILHSWRAKYVKAINELSRPIAGAYRNDLSSATYVQNAAQISTPSANFGGALSTGSAIQDCGDIYLDFCSDGITDVRELGSLLDTNAYAARGLEVSINGNVTTSATTTKASQMSLTGRRFYGDLSQFQLLSL